MKLFAWQPRAGVYGELSWFVMAEDEEAARAAVEAEIARRKALNPGELDRLWCSDCGGWGTDEYIFTAADKGVVLANTNVD